MGPSGPGWLPAADRLLVVLSRTNSFARGVCVPSVFSFGHCSDCCSATVRTSMRAVAAVTILLLALSESETVHAFGGGVPFALDADGCVVDYKAGCAGLYLQPHSPEASLARFTAHVSSYKLYTSLAFPPRAQRRLLSA